MLGKPIVPIFKEVPNHQQLSTNQRCVIPQETEHVQIYRYIFGVNLLMPSSNRTCHLFKVNELGISSREFQLSLNNDHSMNPISRIGFIVYTRYVFCALGAKGRFQASAAV
jgi:hypothetical protein